MKKSVTKCTMEQALEVLAPYANDGLISINETDIKGMFQDEAQVEYTMLELDRVEDLSQIELSKELERDQFTQAIIHATHPLGVDIPASTIAALMSDILQKNRNARLSWGLCEAEDAQGIILRAFTS